MFPISVSGVWAQYFERFDADAIVSRYFVGWATRGDSKYYEQIQHLRRCGLEDAVIGDRIKADWTANGALASARGTRMHRQIEFALGGELYDATGADMNLFHSCVQRIFEPRGWKVFRVEWSIYCDDAMVAGQIDAIFIAPDGYHMVDWKRCRELLDPTAKLSFCRYGRPPCAELLDNACNHYFIQQNMYGVILERHYNISLASMSLAQFHPDLSEFNFVEVPDYRSFAASILDDFAQRRERNMPWEARC